MSRNIVPDPVATSHPGCTDVLLTPKADPAVLLCPMGSDSSRPLDTRGSEFASVTAGAQARGSSNLGGPIPFGFPPCTTPSLVCLGEPRRCIETREGPLLFSGKGAWRRSVDRRLKDDG